MMSPPRASTLWFAATYTEAAGVVVHHDRLLLVLAERVARLQQLLAVHLPRAVQVPGLILFARAQVEHERALVHEADQFLRRDGDLTI